MTSTQNDSIFYKKGTKYECTISPSDKYQFFGQHDRLLKFLTFIQSRLSVSFTDWDASFTFFLELSEPTALNKDDPKKCSSGSRLHIHGYFEFPTSLSVGQFLLNGQYWLTRYSDVQINAYRADYWPKYCRKQQHIIKMLCKSSGCLPSTLTNDTPVISVNTDIRKRFIQKASAFCNPT